jgi:hypothetical protein
MPRYLVLDIHCRPCRPDWRDGDPGLPPRLARFARLADGGPVEVRRFKYKGQLVHPYPHRRPDGGVTWQLLCPHGHNRPVRHERVVAALDAIPPGTGSIRIAL